MGIQLPDGIAERFKEAAAEAGLGGSKNLMTVAVAILVALPEADRDALARFVLQRTYKRPDALDPAEVLDFLAYILRTREAEKREADPRWEVMYIVDPEVTPEPGKKASDRAKQDDWKQREGRA